MLWKQRFERLASMMDDMKHTIANEGLETADSRAWDAPEKIYVSFCFDVCDNEAHAIEQWGEDNYDVYTLERKSPK